MRQLYIGKRLSHDCLKFVCYLLYHICCGGRMGVLQYAICKIITLASVATWSYLNYMQAGSAVMAVYDVFLPSGLG